MRIADRVQETTNATGTGALTFDGAVTGYRSVSSVYTTGEVIPYVVTDDTDFEIGIGAVTSGSPWTLTRTTIIASSNGGAAINVTAGSKIFCDATTAFLPRFKGKQTHAASHSTTSAITITGDVVECTTDGDADVDYLYLPAGSYDGQRLTVFVKSCGAVADILRVYATFVDGNTFVDMGSNPVGKGLELLWSTTATAGWTITAVNSVVNDRSTNASTATQSPGTSRAYVTGSRLNAPKTGFKIGTILRWTITVTKTAAGTAAPVIDIAFGTAGTTADTARVTLTGAAQTAISDVAVFIITAVVRGPISASCVVHGTLNLNNNASFTTGFKTQKVQAASAAFAITTAGIGAGICMTAGSSAAWTIQSVFAEYITN